MIMGPGSPHNLASATFPKWVNQREQEVIVKVEKEHLFNVDMEKEQRRLVTVSLLPRPSSGLARRSETCIAKQT